jgi:predicted tellurium resistance membrane protein TerC
MFDFSIFAEADAWVALLTLTALEIVLGIDNIVFISIVTDDLPPSQQARARSIGLALAMISRLALLFTIVWIMGLKEPFFTVFGQAFSGRDLILGGGGLFLLAKATHEIFHIIEVDEVGKRKPRTASFVSVILQIMVLDIVFSFDSVITAVGMAEHLLIMAMAVCIAVVIMLFAAGPISRFVNRRPSMKVLALSFLLLIGAMLVGESLGQHINKGYIYFAMSFSLLVELINLRVRKLPVSGAPHGPTALE